MGHIIILSHCRDAAGRRSKLRNLLRVQNHCLLCLQHVQTAVREKPVTVHYIWVFDSPRPTEILKYCIRQYLPKNTGRPRMHQMKWCKRLWERASSFCSIFFTQSRARASACLSKKWLIIISALLVSTEMPQPSCRLLLDEENAIKTSSAFY